MKERNKKIIDGLIILNKYESCYIEAGHDVIWSGVPNLSVSTKDAIKLVELHWRLEDGCWSRSV